MSYFNNSSQTFIFEVQFYSFYFSKNIKNTFIANLKGINLTSNYDSINQVRTFSYTVSYHKNIFKNEI